LNDLATRTPPYQALVVRIKFANYLAVWCLDKPKAVDLGIGSQAADQANVGTLWRFDRADAAVVRMMDVTHIEAGPLAPQATRPQRGKRSLMAQ
jgi:hypothetical protein